jgi:hypothetical protein
MEGIRVLKIQRDVAKQLQSVEPKEYNQTKNEGASKYSGMTISVSRMKELKDRGDLVASCMVTVGGHVKLLECVIMRQYDEYRVLMPRRMIGRRSVPAVELSKALEADVRNAVLSAWLSYSCEPSK